MHPQLTSLTVTKNNYPFSPWQPANRTFPRGTSTCDPIFLFENVGVCVSRPSPKVRLVDCTKRRRLSQGTISISANCRRRRNVLDEKWVRLTDCHGDRRRRRRRRRLPLFFLVSCCPIDPDKMAVDTVRISNHIAAIHDKRFYST